ncbi:MAG: ACP S-malonyltransferase [Dehalococcoidia bacterium]
MTTILVDHNMEGQAATLWREIVNQGWPDLVPLELATFATVGLPVTSSDRVIWRFVQAQRMLLLTNNRNASGDDSLLQTIREELNAASLPVLTIGNLDRLAERDYRQRCAECLVDIVLDLPIYLGTGRMFIP